MDDLFEIGQVGPDLVDHRHVVGRLEVGRRHQAAAPGLLQRVAHLVGAVGRIDVDEDHADARRRVLHEHPLRAVRRPDPDPVAALEAARHERPGELVDAVVELGVGPTHVLVADHQRLAVGVPLGGRVEVVADRALEERYVGRSDCVREAGLRHGSTCSTGVDVPTVAGDVYVSVSYTTIGGRGRARARVMAPEGARDGLRTRRHPRAVPRRRARLRDEGDRAARRALGRRAHVPGRRRARHGRTRACSGCRSPRSTEAVAPT